MAAKRLVRPTTARLEAIASLAPKPTTYLSMGTARIEPPPPSRPSEIPINTARRRPTIAIILTLV